MFTGHRGLIDTKCNPIDFEVACMYIEITITVEPILIYPIAALMPRPERKGQL